MKKKISKIMAVLLSVVILLTNAIPTFAALTEGNRYSFTTRYLDAYYNTGTWETADGHTHSNSGQVALRNLSNGEPLYCIQIYNAVNSDAATAENIKDTVVWDKELTPTAKNGMTKVSIYGYPNYTYGYSATDAQLATQVLLWDFEIDRRHDFSVATTAFARNIFSNYPNAQKCYLEILEACSGHYNRPSFSGNTISLKGTGSNNSITVTDTNGVLNGYTVTSSNDRLHVSKSGNKLTVYATGSGSLSARIIFTKNNTEINSAFALTGANQTLFYGTIADPVHAPLTVELTLGSITVHKNSEDGMHAQEFVIKGNSINKTVKTNSDGTVTLSDLPEGTYTVSEVNVDKYYPHTEPKTVTVKAGQNSNVYFNNLLVKGKIDVIKYGDILSTIKQNKDGTYTPVYKKTLLPNAEYKVYAAEDIVTGNIKVSKNTLVDTIVTDKNGKATTKDLYLKNNGTAKYKLIESKAPAGYVLDKEEHVVTLTQNGASVDVSSKLEAFNTRQKASISFNKSIELDDLFNIGNNDEIKNIQFGLYAQKSIKATDGTVIPAGALIERMNMSDIVNSDNETSNSIIASYSVKTDIPFGSFYIQEIATDNHYILDDTKYPFTFSAANQNQKVVNIQINDGKVIKNTLKRGEIQGLKLDDSDNTLAGATIGLFADGTEEFTEETALMTTITAEDGTFRFSDLTADKYIVKELIAPDDYLIDPNSYPVEITDNEQIVTLQIIDVLKRGDIQGKKLDDSGNVLAGAVIGLFPAGTEEFTKDTALLTTISDEDGIFEFLNIPVGSYIVKELESPEDYLLDETAYEVTISEDKQIITLEIINVLKRGDIQGKKLDDSGNVLAGAVIGLFPAGTEEFTKDTALSTTVSDKDGIFEFLNIPVGSYIVKELESPEDYLLDETAYEVTISEDKQIITLEIINVLKRGNIQGLKVDNNENPLAGAVIGLFPAGTEKFTKNTALMTVTSSKDGSFSFTNIPVGSYIVKELEAPEGYILDEKSYEVNITENQQVINIKIVNTLKIGKLTLSHKFMTSPKTGADYTIVTVILVSAVIVFAIASIITMKKKRKVQR